MTAEVDTVGDENEEPSVASGLWVVSLVCVPTGSFSSALMRASRSAAKLDTSGCAGASASIAGEFGLATSGVVGVAVACVAGVNSVAAVAGEKVVSSVTGTDADVA